MSQECEWTQSLCELFEPPDETRRGVFGLMCALSADRDFTRDVLERFTGLGGQQRRRLGRCSLALFLDQHSDPLTCQPGLYAPYPAHEWPSSEMYMHAKVALLGFGPAAHGDPNFYRLIVSTGNWTKSAVNHEINLVWFCDYDGAAGDEQAAADMREAAEFWRRLLGLTDNGSPAGYYALCDDMRDKCAAFLKTLESRLGRAPADAPTPRFFSTLQPERADKIGRCEAGSIGAHVIRRFADTGRKRNFMITGSGFFEQANGKAGMPCVLEELQARLKEEGLLTKKPGWWVICNPETSGAVGDWVRDGTAPPDCEYGKPKHPASHTASLHAKYVYLSSNTSDNHKHVHKHGLLYLGSGNLSKQGFMLVPSTGGNVEAGVAIPVDTMDHKALCNALGIDPDNDLEPKDIPAQPDGEGAECQSGRIDCPPISACRWNRETRVLTVERTDQFEEYGIVRVMGREVAQPDAKLQLNQDEEPPAHIEVKVTADNPPGPWYVPVLDSQRRGELWAPPVRYSSIADMLDALRSFPDIYDDDEEAADDDSDSADEQCGNGESSGFVPDDDRSELRNEWERYPLHLATTLMETVAEQNQQVSEELMPDYIDHLRRTLIEGLDDTVRQGLAKLREYLAPLKAEPGFAPSPPSDDYKQVIEEFLAKLAELDNSRSGVGASTQECEHVATGN